MNHTEKNIFGFHAVEAVLKKQPDRIIRLILLDARQDIKHQAIIQLAKANGINKISIVSRVELDQLTHQGNHQGFAAICTPQKPFTENDLAPLLDSLTEPPFLLILDGIQDPHNLGACLRSADAAGVHAVIAPKDKSVGLTSTVSKVASGAAEHVPFIQVTNLARILRFLKEQDIWLFGAAGEAKENLYQANLTLPVAIILGAEGVGLRRLTREHCDQLFHIPMIGSVSSLNVSVAAGVFLFETRRQRGCF